MQRFTAVLAQPLPALYATTFTGTGGNAFLVSELAKRLNDTTDDNRPPFDNNEYVMGLCVVAGGPREADIAPIADFLGLLFGTTRDRAFFNILDVIDTVVTEQEAAFGPDMRPLVGTDPATIDPLTGRPYATETPVIAEDGTAVESGDPANPNAGDTNIVPLSDLC
jgi:hypothetical protein